MALVPFQRSNSSFSSSSSSSSQSCPPQWRFDVFLSFRGEDTRDNFISHLYKELDRKGINTFKDDEKLKVGKKISPELLKAIEESRFSIVVISKSYASSRWCLDELVKILECKNTRGQEVYPVFFHVDPSEVRKQTGTFGVGFNELVSKYETAKVESWREALKGVANLSGLAYPDAAIGSESKLIEEIVGKFFHYLNHGYTIVDESLVGMDSHTKEVIELLGMGKNDSRVVGIWGMGGIGKTTIAKVVYDRISWQFDGYCFIENVRAISTEYGIMFLQKQLISQILKEKVKKVNNISSGKSMIKSILSHKNVLIVLDDVDESIELENLLGDHEWFNFGSRIIITTRDLHVLKRWRAMHIYKVRELNKNDAVKLFKSKAFRKDKQIRGYGNLLDRAVEYCKGVPLALKVLGSFLLNREEIDWECALNKLECSTLSKVEEVLKISYDALGLEEKEIFLGIAVFFKERYINDVERILKSYISQPLLGIKLLDEKSLITISSYSQLIMHDLIQEMGRNIVFQESPKKPGQRSWLWLFKDIKHVLMNNTGTEKVEGIVMEDCNLGSQDPLELSSKAFAKLRNLRILKIRCSLLSEDFKYLPNNLSYLEWHGYPLRCMPSKFQPMHLVELHMCSSNIKQLWTGTKVLYNLRIMDLSNSKYLTESPNFEIVPNLEELYLGRCTSLVNLHPSIGSLIRLVCLELDECENLESIPNDIGQLKALEDILLRGCLKLKKLPKEVGDLDCLKTPFATNARIRQLPPSICQLYSLKKLCIEENDFESLPTNMNQLSSLESIDLCNCKRLQELPELSANIKSIYVDQCESLRTITNPSIYKNIAEFNFFDCFKLLENKENNLLSDEFLTRQFQGSRDRENDKFEIVFPGSNIPKWFNHQRNGSSICLELPPHWFNIKFFGIAVAIVGIMKYQGPMYLKFGFNHKTIYFFLEHDKLVTRGIRFENVTVCYIPREMLSSHQYQLNEGKIKFKFDSHNHIDVKKWGVRFVYKDDVEGNDQALTIYDDQASEDEDEDVNVPLERGPSGSGDFQEWPLQKRDVRVFVFDLFHRTSGPAPPPPVAGKIKLNIDGCARVEFYGGGIGGLFRDEEGSWILGYAGNHFYASSLEAEVFSIYLGLAITLHKGFYGVIVETDSLEILNFIKEGAPPNFPLRSLVEDSRATFRRCGCSIRYIPTHKNFCAYRLAVMGAKVVTDQVRVRVWKETPLEIRRLLAVDRVPVGRGYFSYEDDDVNAPPLKRRPSGSGNFLEEDCPNIKRPQLLVQELNTTKGKIKLNTDECARDDLGNGGFGGLFRDEEGSWIYGYFGKHDYCSSLEAKVWSIYRGLTITLEKGFYGVIVETDSLEILNFIEEGAPPNFPLQSLVDDSTAIFRRCGCSIWYSPRRGNMCAYILANMGSDQQEPFVDLEEPPIAITSLLAAKKVRASGGISGTKEDYEAITQEKENFITKKKDDEANVDVNVAQTSDLDQKLPITQKDGGLVSQCQ